MTTPSQPSWSPSRWPSEPVELWKFKNWEQTVQAIRSAVNDITSKEKDVPIFVATVSEAEFKAGQWMAMPANMITQMPAELIVSMFNALYSKFSTIDLYQNELPVSGQKTKQVIAVYRV